MVVKELSEFNINEIVNIYKEVGWTNYTDDPGMLESAFENSLIVLGAFDGDKTVGILRAVGDGCSVVFIQDILVLPKYQRKGIGTALVRALRERFCNVYQMHLMTDDTPETTKFYRSLGFSRAEDIGCCAFTYV